MPRVNLSFWGVLRDGILYEVHRTKAKAVAVVRTYRPGSKHVWAIHPVQVIYE